MNMTTTRQEVITGGHDGGMAASSHAVSGDSGGFGWSQQRVIVEDHSTPVHRELMQKSSVMEQQESTLTMSGRQDMNAGTTALMTATTRTLSPTSNTGPSLAGRSDLPPHRRTEYRVLLSMLTANGGITT